jgi:hypothetical protein
MIQSLLVVTLLAGVADEPYFTWDSKPVKTNPRQGTVKPVGQRLSDADINKLVNESPIVPFRDVTVAVRLNDGTVWAGSKRGLMHLAPQSKRWKLFHSRRWLLDDNVVDLLVDSGTSAYVKTTAGINRISRRRTSLSAKIAKIDSEVQKRHVRKGLVGELHLTNPGDLQKGARQPDNDNDGLWTSMYVAAEAFRYGATGDSSAKENAKRSLDALMFLESITGKPGFVARSVVPISAPLESLFDKERWRVSRDRKWRWKSETSSDELVGHYFAYAVYFDVVATRDEREAIRKVVARITDHIINNDFQYIDPDGKRTRWGVWRPQELNGDPKWANERGLGSLEILSHLKVAAYITGNARYDEKARELIEKHEYAKNTVNQKIIDPPSEIHHSDDELAFLSYYPLLVLERDPALRETYLASIRRSWEIERPEHSPLFNFIYAAALQAGERRDSSTRPAQAFVDPNAYDQNACVAWFREVPEDLVCWTVDNTGRGDTSPARVIPVSERALMKWNGNPYLPKDGHDGRRMDDGTFILLPYWMGQYHRFID